MSYKDYIRNPKEILKLYEIYDERVLESNYCLSAVCLKTDINLHFFLSAESFSISPASITRLLQLIKAYENSLFLLETLFISKFDNNLTLYLVYPMPDRGDIHPFFQIFDRIPKLKIFSDLLSVLSNFHKLEIPYLELSPAKIIYKANDLYLLPFKISPNLSDDTNFYSSPEIIAGIAGLDSQYPADVWALACIYAELFISITPLFQAVTCYERLLRMFEVLGVPE